MKLKAIAEEVGIPTRLLAFEAREVNNVLTAWVHPLIAIDLLQWLSMEARIECAKKSPAASRSPKQVILHKWEGHNISQVSADFVINGVVIPAEYVNATEMCKANGKLWADYARQKGVIGYWQALGNDMGIPISLLVLVVEGFGGDQATWVHPEIATDLAQWVSYPFRIWATRTLIREMIALKQKAGSNSWAIATRLYLYLPRKGINTFSLPKDRLMLTNPCLQKFLQTGDC